MKKILEGMIVVAMLMAGTAWAGWNRCALPVVGVTGDTHYIQVEGCAGADAIPDGTWYQLWKPFDSQQAEVAIQANLADRRVSFHLAEACVQGEGTCLPYINAIYLNR